MTNSALLTILHLSDFHFTRRKQRDQGIVVEALVTDLRALCIGHRKPDLIIFTGDLVQAAGTDQHDDAYDFLLEPVSKATGCSDERIFIIPGNHDLSWKALEDFAAEHAQWRELLGQSDETQRINEIFEAGKFDNTIERKFSAFSDLDRYLRGDEGLENRSASNAFAAIDHIPALNIDLVSINTAALSTGGNKRFAMDEQQLFVPEYAILDVTKRLRPESFKIFGTHHPFAMLSEQSSRMLSGTIEELADLHLFGHMHDPQPRSTVGLKGEILADQAGAVFTARQNAYIGYSLLTIDRSERHTEIHLRSYFDERKSFDAAIDRIEDGVWYSSIEARQHFRLIATPIDEDELRKHLLGPALASLKAEEALTGGEGSVHEKFVAPPLNRTFLQPSSSVEGKDEVESPIPFSDLVSDDGNVILYAISEYGRTTLVRELRMRLLSEALDLSLPRLPVIIDFADIKSNAVAMMRVAKSRTVEVPPGHDLESLLKLGNVCMMIDDVLFSDSKRMKILRDFVSAYPKARYIFTSVKSSATAFGAHVDPEMPVRFDFVEINELKRNDMRNLLNKFDGCTDVEDWLDRLQNEFREISLPFTAANGSILAEILQEKHNFSPVNRAVLIEQFVDSTLRKAAIEQSKRETFDYTNKTDLLAQIASWMAKSDNYVPSKEAMRAEMGRYVNSLGLNASLDDLIQEFFLSKILIGRPDEHVSFRYRAVLEYFIALKMTSDHSFREWVLDDSRYLQYGHEIEFYAGKLRNDSALVSSIGERYEKILDEVVDVFGGVDLEKLALIELPKDDDETVESLIDELSQVPLSKEDKDSELDQPDANGDDLRQDVARPAIDEVGDRLILALNLYSGVIKNMELISDAEKRYHLGRVWRGWAVLLHTALRMAPKLAVDRKLRVNGVLYEIRAPHGMKSALLLRQIMLGLPSVHIRMLSSALGTEKLERQLTEPSLGEVGEPMVYTLLRTGLIADLRLAATPGAVESAVQSMKQSNYMLRSLVTFMSIMRRHDRLREEHFPRIEESLAGAISHVKGGTHNARMAEKRRQIARLSKDRLLIQMKRGRDI